MAKFVNMSGGMLILPDGVKVPNGGEVEIDAKLAKENVGVAGWIAGGQLATPKDAKAADKAE